MGRSPCCEKTGLKKGPWTQEEDRKLIDYIHKNGGGNWRTLPKNAGLERCGKSCRLRWTNYLRPDIKRGRFSFEEEETIIQLHSVLGNKWSAIAARLPGRTDNEIKNYWNTHIRKRLLRMGIDPVTHSPRLDLLDLSTLLNYRNQANFSRLLGMQSLINPEILKLATSLFSSQRQILMQNQLINHNTQIVSNHIQTSDHNRDFSSVPICETTGQIIDNQVMQYDDIQQFHEFPSFGEVREWQQSIEDGSLRVSTYKYYGSDQMNGQDLVPSLDTFQANNFSLQSNMSTPSSSPTPLNSNSTHINSSTATKPDERESYCCSSIFDQIPDILDVNDYCM